MCCLRRCWFCVVSQHVKVMNAGFQAHDEICPKYPMICEGCAKKKIPREKVSKYQAVHLLFYVR